MRYQIGLCAGALLLVSNVSASAFSSSFKWCGSGSPSFALQDVPKGTTKLSFQMIDKSIGNFHGGGDVVYSGQKSIPCEALRNYTPPSPPSGFHIYEFTVTAQDGSGNTLGKASSSRKFPE